MQMTISSSLIPGTPHTEQEREQYPQSVDQFFRKAFDWIGVNGASTQSPSQQLTYLHLNEGWSLREIMDISGHKNLLSLQQYLDTDRKVTFEKYRNLFAKEDV